MKEVVVETTATIEQGADAVWTRISAFGKLHELLPQLLQNTTQEGEGIGAVRTIVLADGGDEIIEELTAFDAADKSFSYRLLEGDLPFENYTATMEVSSDAPDACHVKWTSSYRVAEDMESAAHNVVKGMQTLLMRNLSRAE
jgi:mxaD protein